MHELSTERLLLRMFRESDLDGYAAMFADPEVTRYIGEGRTLPRWEAWRSMAAMLGHWQLRGYGMWALERRSDGELVGRAGLWNPEGWPGIEAGWTLRREFWGHGYATEAARASLEFAFHELKLPRIISLIHPENHRSIRVAERLGERRDGQTELFGKPALIYAILCDQWTGGAIGSWDDRRLR
jgi:RimJ/RimL family protein N-acetyltransferase